MKMLQSLTQHINHWRRGGLAQHLRWRSRPFGARRIAQALKQSIGTTWQSYQPRRSLLCKKFSDLLCTVNPTQPLPRRRCCKANRPSIALMVAVVSLTSTLGHRFYNQPKLDVNTIAPQTIRAPGDATIVDTKATEAKRKAASRDLVPVLMVDRAVDRQIYQQLQQTLAQIDELREFLVSFPFTKSSVLSLSTQLYLRDCQEWEWRTVLTSVNVPEMGKSMQFSSSPPTPISPLPQLQRAVVELQAYQRSTSAQNLAALLEKISQARQHYAQALSILSQKCRQGGLTPSLLSGNNSQIYVTAAILTEALNTPECGYASLLGSSEPDWQKTQTGIYKAAERILTQGIPPGLPTAHLQQAVSIQVKNQIPETLQSPATELLLAVLQPNLKQDAQQTQLLAEQAVQAVQPETIEVRQGEVIVPVGKVITQADFLLLDHFGLSRRGLNWLGLIGFGALISGAIAVFWLVQRRFHPGLRRRDYMLVLLLTLSAPLLVSLSVRYTSLPAIGLLVGSFYGSALGVTTVGLMGLVLPVSLETAWEHLFADAVGGILGGFMAGRLRSREELALLGIAVGLTEGVVYLLVNLIVSGATGLLWYVVLREAALYSLTGLAWSVVALGLSPYLEHLFDLVTSIRLAELANPNRALLQRLAEEAPGTFQHTLLVATLAEAAAKALGCNVELVRTGTLYHDIGKLHDPQGFIENQMGQPNKHDAINDPWQSAAIIKKHVTEGLVMARKHRLPTAIQAFIPEHQGTMLIAYFYHQAQQLTEANHKQGETLQVTIPILREEDFRYDGPIPQSRETAIVMLADSCEAALRSLKDATYEEALSMVNKMLKARWQDNQLVDSGLTREEMRQLAEVFVQVWQQFHHKRIAYPKLGAKKAGERAIR